MAVNTVFHKGDNDGAGPSPKIWGNCPMGDMLQNPNVGYHFFDDFMDFGVKTLPTTVGQRGAPPHVAYRLLRVRDALEHGLGLDRTGILSLVHQPGSSSSQIETANFEQTSRVPVEPNFETPVFLTRNTSRVRSARKRPGRSGRRSRRCRRRVVFLNALARPVPPASGRRGSGTLAQRYDCTMTSADAVRRRARRRHARQNAL